MKSDQLTIRSIQKTNLSIFFLLATKLIVSRSLEHLRIKFPSRYNFTRNLTLLNFFFKLYLNLYFVINVLKSFFKNLPHK